MTTTQEQFTRILQAAAAESGVTPADLTGPRRFDYLCIARYFAIGLASELTKIPTHDLGHALNRSNAMIRRSIKICNELCIADTRIARRYDNLRRTINLGNISDKVRRLSVDKVIEHVLEHLPEGWAVHITVKYGDASVRAERPDGTTVHMHDDESDFEEQVRAAVRLAHDEAASDAMTRMAKIGGGK